MTYEIVHVSSPALYKPPKSSRLLNQALKKVQRARDPLGASMEEIDEQLARTEGLLGITYAGIDCVPPSRRALARSGFLGVAHNGPYPGCGSPGLE